MTRNIEDALQLLRYQLNYLEQGGFSRVADQKSAPSPFRDSMTCLNYGDPLRSHACRECILYQFVPDPVRTEDIPCHYIPLDESGRTIASSLREGKTADLDAALQQWLKQAIAKLQREV